MFFERYKDVFDDRRRRQRRDRRWQATTSDKVKETPQGLADQSKAKAQDGGTWSKSRTDTKIQEGEATSRTRSMSHAPGGPPGKSTIEQTVPVQK